MGVDVMDLISLEDVMEEFGLGPNGGASRVVGALPVSKLPPPRRCCRACVELTWVASVLQA